MAAAVESLCSSGRKARGSIARYEMVIFSYRNVSGEAAAEFPRPLAMSSTGPFAKFLISSTEV
jgi:hypothetical protein